jgi:cysteine desulfurase / selenocysteine lyase
MADNLTNWTSLKPHFPSLEGKTFLNTATMGQLPRATTEALIGHLQRRDLSACSDLLDWFADLERIRGKVAQLVNATPADIAFVPSTAHALSILLQGIDWKPGDKIITFESEFPNNTYAPSLLTRRGVEFLEIPFAELDAHLDERVRLVIVSALNYVTGFRAPLLELRSKLDRVNALLYVDATQGCGGLHFDLAALRPDVMGVHGYKWLLSPTGAGFIYVREDVRRWLEPNVIGWRSHHTWQDLDNLHHGPPVFSDAADRYEGYFPAMPLLYGLEQSVDLFLSLGPANIERRILEVADVLRREVKRLGGTVANESTPILACRFPGRDSSQLARELAARNVQVSARHGYLRVSVHLYNDEQDVAAFVDALQ